MKRSYHWVGSVVLPLMVVVMGVGLAAWKYDAIQEGQAASANVRIGRKRLPDQATQRPTGTRKRENRLDVYYNRRRGIC